jgi:hypothetical protein
MKLSTLCLAIPVLAFGCQNTPLKNIREMYSLDDLKRFQEERAVKCFMFNHAIYHDDLEIFTLFFTYGKSKRVAYEDVPLSQADRDGAEPVYFHPLHLAAQVGALKVTHFCLENKANVNTGTISQMPEFNENTPAHIATAYGNHEVLKMLLSGGGFNLNSKNGVGKTIEDIAREKNDQVALGIIEDVKSKIK